GIDNAFAPRFRLAGGILPPGEGFGSVGSTHDVGKAITIHVDWNVNQILNVNGVVTQFTEFVFYPTNIFPSGRRRSLLIPVLGGNNIEAPVPVHVRNRTTLTRA